MIKKITCFTAIFFLYCPQIQADTLPEISEFSKQICDEIKPEGSISRQEIEAKLEGRLKGVAKLIGAEVAADGTFKKGDVHWKGLPYGSLPDQMKDSRSCKKEIASMLLRERIKK